MKEHNLIVFVNKGSAEKISDLWNAWENILRV